MFIKEGWQGNRGWRLLMNVSFIVDPDRFIFYITPILERGREPKEKIYKRGVGQKSL